MVDTPVLVAGHGPAGLAAALAMAGRGVAVLAVAPGAATPDRAEMLPVAAGAILVRLGLETVLDRATRLRAVTSNWQAARPVPVDGGLSPGGFGPGWSIDRAELARAMAARAEALAVRMRVARIRGVSGRAGAWRVALSGGKTLSAAFLIDATGRPALLARRLGARLQVGLPLVARVWSTDATEPPLMQVEATPYGWSYRLPRATGGGSVGLLTGPEMHGNGAPQDAIRVDARSQRLSPLTGPGWLAAGDAAAAFDPVASQGLFNALTSGFFAGAAAADWLNGRVEALEVYGHLMARTAARTHTRIPMQYAASRFQTPFWATRAARQTVSRGVSHGL